MEITAKLIRLGNASEGTSQKGPWRKATAVFETQEQYPNTVAVDFFNTRLEEVAKIPLGSICKVKFDVSSREYNGKWYTNLNGSGVEVLQAHQQHQPEQRPIWDTPVPPIGQNDQLETEDLPF